jgi:uncharacterized membrane protein YphA (DoxX/SURF4 family)
MKAIITGLSRLIVGGLFVFSGVVKANDPMGFTYKLEEYFTVFGMSWLDPAAPYMAILACVVEVFVGILLLLGLWRNLALTLLMLMVVFFGFLTFYSAYFQVVQDCGCFGDLLKMTPWESFYKNVALFALAIILVRFRYLINPLFSEQLTKQIGITGLGLAILFPIYTYNFLPVWDFRPYEVGNNIAELMKVPEDAPEAKYKTRHIYKNTKTGNTKSFKTENLPSGDTWKWDTTINKQIQKGYQPPIHDFSLQSFDGYNYTKDFLSQKGYRIVVVHKNLKTANKQAQEDLNELAKKVKGNRHINIWGLTASSLDVFKKFKEETGVNYRYFLTDKTTLKTIIRSNPGVLLMKANVVKAKWSAQNIPSFKEVKQLMDIPEPTEADR